MTSPARYVIENVSRQAGKSTCSAAMAVHQAVFFPGSLVLVVSPTLRQSGELQRKAMKFYELVDPHHEGLAEDTKLSIQLTNGSRIIALPGQEDNLRGYSAPALIIEDEASRVKDELAVAIRPMLATSSTGRLILLSTPNGKVGHFHKIWTEGGPEWLKIKVTADQIPRISPEFLANERLNMTESQFLQEYYGEFQEAEGAVFSSDLFKSLANPSVSAMNI
ncbi:MAG: terminase family protein [Methanothrix sp.]|nr:terminase family protein [Methanothrix sp.]